MAILIAGLVIFLGAHSVRILANPWRSEMIGRIGEKSWKGLYSLVAGLGLALTVWGFARARADASLLWTPIPGVRHLSATLMLVAFVLFAAAYVPDTRIRRWVGNPMILSVAVWSFAHLLANGRSADLALFGGFLAWAIFDFFAATRRDRATPRGLPAGSLGHDLIAVAVGVAAWAIFAFALHGWLFGVRPLG